MQLKLKKWEVQLLPNRNVRSFNYEKENNIDSNHNFNYNNTGNNYCTINEMEKY